MRINLYRDDDTLWSRSHEVAVVPAVGEHVALHEDSGSTVFRVMRMTLPFPPGQLVVLRLGQLVEADRVGLVIASSSDASERLVLWSWSGAGTLRWHLTDALRSHGPR